MEFATSVDGTRIAFDRHAGDAAGNVILIGGAFSHRTLPQMQALARAIAEGSGMTVINYDRRGRGDSADTLGRYDAAQEIDDLAALVRASSGSVSLVGWSSGAVLALVAAASGRIDGIERIVAFEPPFIVDHDHHVPPADLGDALAGLVSANRRSEIVRLYMTKAMGIPSVFVRMMRFLPVWSELMATATSTQHDWAVMHAFMRGEPLDREDWTGVSAPTLVLVGSKSEPLLRNAAQAIADVLPNVLHREVPGLTHNPNPRLFAAAVAGFLTAEELARPTAAVRLA